MVAKANLIGKRFGRLVVVESLPSAGGHSQWLCTCDCGKVTKCSTGKLSSGAKRSCGCLRIAEARSRTIDLVGTKSGRLSIVAFAGRSGKSTLWECECECGNRCVKSSHDIRQGGVQSCGCLFADTITKHGLSKSPEYTAWEAMVQRCRNPNNPGYKNYGGRGIAVCDQWVGPGGFERFLAAVGRRPGNGFSIDRINNELGYEPGNCRWATKREQLANRRCALLMRVGGEMLGVDDLCKRMAISRWEARKLIKNWMASGRHD